MLQSSTAWLPSLPSHHQPPWRCRTTEFLNTQVISSHLHRWPRFLWLAKEQILPLQVHPKVTPSLLTATHYTSSPAGQVHIKNYQLPHFMTKQATNTTPLMCADEATTQIQGRKDDRYCHPSGQLIVHDERIQCHTQRRLTVSNGRTHTHTHHFCQATLKAFRRQSAQCAVSH